MRKDLGSRYQEFGRNNLAILTLGMILAKIVPRIFSLGTGSYLVQVFVPANDGHLGVWGCKWCWEGTRQTGFADECANKVVMQDNGRAREGPMGKGECFGQRQH